MKVDGVVFKTYLLDSFNTVVDRIALERGVLPRHLQFSPPLNELTRIGDPETSVRVTNLIEPFVGQTSLTFPEAALPPDGSEQPGNGSLSRLEAEELFIVYHKTLAQSPSLLGYIPNLLTPSPSEVLKRRDRRIAAFRADLAVLKSRVSLQLKEFEEFEQIPSAPLVSYEPSKVVFNVFCDTDTSLEELFNSVVTTRVVPYANFNNFHKIAHNFQTNPDWLDFESVNAVLLKVDCTRAREPSRSQQDATDTQSAPQARLAAGDAGAKAPVARFYQRYTNAVAAISGSRLFFTAETKTGPKNVTREEFLDRLFEAIPCIKRDSIVSVEEIATVGVVVYPSQVFFAPVWADLSLNTPLFSKLLAVEESLRASKTRPDLYMFLLNSQPDTVKMVAKETERPMMYTMVDEGTPYIRAKIKTKRRQDALRHQELLAKLVTVYSSEASAVLAIYRSYIPSFLQEEEALMRSRLKKLDGMDLRAIAPDVFFPNYSRKCLKRPTVVSEEEATKLVESGRMVMPFPIFGESKKRYYICEHKTHPYLGLRENQLENKKMFPYVPCCYIRNQDREGTRLSFYYNQNPTKEQQPAVQDIFLSGKILPAGMPGVLPENIKQLFTITEPNPENQFIRFGVNKNDNSLIEAVMLAINHSNLQYKTTAERIGLVAKQRDILREHALPYAYAAKQELFDQPISDIKDRLTAGNLRATEFVRSIEQFFDCNILVFCSHEKNTAGELVIPPHTQTYLKNAPNRQTVLIYELERDNTSHCELIVQNTADKPKTLAYMTTVFTPNDQIVKNLWQVFSDMNRSFNLNKLIVPLRLPFFAGLAHGLGGDGRSAFRSPSLGEQPEQVGFVFSQIVDNYGKARVLNIDYKNVKMTVVSDPLPPYAAVKATKVYRAPLALVAEVVEKIGAVIVEQRVVNAQVREVVATITSTTPTAAKHTFVFLTAAVGRLPGVPEEATERYNDLFIPERALVGLYTAHKRIARVLYQQALFLFSAFLHQRRVVLDAEQIDPTLASWANDFIEVDPELLRRIDPVVLEKQCLSNSKFNTPTPFVRAGRLVVPSREVVLRIVFMVRLFAKTNLNTLLSFRTKKFMDGLFAEASDFTFHPDQFVLDSPDAVKGLINAFQTDTRITKTLRPDHPKPYFVYTSVAPNSVFVARNTLVSNDQRTDLRGRIKSVLWDAALHNPQASSKPEFEGDAPSTRKERRMAAKLRQPDSLVPFLSGVSPLQTAVYIVRFWNRFRFNPTASELRAEVGNLNTGDVDVYSWASFDNVINLTNHSNPDPGMVFAYKVNGNARYTALLPI
jgi:hypothetical protein